MSAKINKNILFTIIVTIFVLKGSSANESLKAQIEEKVAILTNTIEDAITTAETNIKAYYDDIIVNGESITIYLASSFQDTSNKFIDEISELAEKNGIDSSICLEDDEEDFITTFKKLFDNTMECVSKQADEANTIVKDANTKITKARSVIDETWEDFRKCSGINLIFCGLKVITDAGVKFISIPLDIDKQVAAAKELLDSAKNNLELCQTNNFETATKDALELSDKIKKCINDKIENVQ